MHDMRGYWNGKYACTHSYLMLDAASAHFHAPAAPLPG